MAIYLSKDREEAKKLISTLRKGDMIHITDAGKCHVCPVSQGSGNSVLDLKATGRIHDIASQADLMAALRVGQTGDTFRFHGDIRELKLPQTIPSGYYNFADISAPLAIGGQDSGVVRVLGDLSLYNKCTFPVDITARLNLVKQSDREPQLLIYGDTATGEVGIGEVPTGRIESENGVGDVSDQATLDAALGDTTPDRVINFTGAVSGKAFWLPERIVRGLTFKFPDLTDEVIFKTRAQDGTVKVAGGFSLVNPSDCGISFLCAVERDLSSDPGAFMSIDGKVLFSSLKVKRTGA